MTDAHGQPPEILEELLRGVVRSEIYLVETWIASFGPMPHALKNLILGVMPRRIDADHRQSEQAR
ncbi:hypothetical protein [Streptomyces collinus]|uniref:hypothetical protein n=1 Tax=Streptomyces collinus TaxID=42684 RepID=UPI002943D58F|nr:hypothetical protein [Streptomyces collinus]